MEIKPRHKGPTHAEKVLDARRQDYTKMVNSRGHEAKVQARIESGGYHKPGSMKK